MYHSKRPSARLIICMHAALTIFGFHMCLAQQSNPLDFHHQIQNRN